MYEKIVSPPQNDVENSVLNDDSNTNPTAPKQVYLRDGTTTQQQNYQNPNNNEDTTRNNANLDQSATQYTNRMRNNRNNLRIEKGKSRF